MSFSRAPLKRFNESVGCAPPPGIYDIKPGEPKGAASFDKSDRFKHSKAVNPISPSRISLTSPVRRTLSVDGLVEGSSAKKDKNAMTLERKQQRLLEKEIRCLVQQRGEQDRRLLSLEDDLRKLEAKLLAAVREKTGLTANITTLERQKAELKKVNEFLKNKVSADTTKKRINSLTMELMEARNNLDSKNEELSVLQFSSEGRVKLLETDLRASKDTLQALKDRNKDLEDIHHVTKTQNEELEQENARLHAEIRALKEEVRVIQGYLDTSNDQIQDLRLKLQGTTQQDLQLQNIEHLEEELEQCNGKLEGAELLLREKEEEALKYQHNLQASKESLLETERKLASQELSSQKLVSDMKLQVMFPIREIQQDSQTAICLQDAEVARLRVVLRRTERELDERVAHLEQRCLFSEEERNKTQEEGFRRVEELKTELYLLKETNREEKKRQIRLQHEHVSLTEELALVDSLSVLLEHERLESEEHRSKLKEELEEVLGELALMEDQEQRRAEATDQSQEVLQKLQEENAKLERQLRDTRELLDRKSSDMSSLKEEHSVAMRKLQEVHTSLLNTLGEQGTELESTKEALRDTEERRKHLEEEMEKATQMTKQVREELDNVIQQQDEEIRSKREELEEHQRKQFDEQRAKEENARVLLEVQVLLAHRDEQMQAMEVSHAARIRQLEQELQYQTKDKEEVLKQVEEKSQEVADLHHEKEIAQKQLKEVHQENVDIKERLLQEKEEKVKYQAALQAACAAREAETKDQQQLRSEVLRLQAELERMDEERSRLISQVELSNESELALKHHVETAEQDRNHLQSRLDELQLKGGNLEAQLALVEEKMEALQCEVDHHHQDQHTLQQQVKVLTEEKVTLQWEMHEQRRELQRKIAEAQENSSSTSETEHWRTQYEDLFAKVKPFQEQLNSFAAERSALLNENGANQEELNKLADAYARLLGHQNQKQKIKHVMKLKDENMDLKQEVLKLRSQVSRQKSDLDQLKSKLPGGCQRRFDPRKAFQHNKENRHTETVAPLKEENRTLERLY
ncbi:hyaluronan mediated motility receptor isoform X2 [Dunckerocampus dactyliophorus]|uniref:hyaluronan mediated motility receptor isoform X2 n=1 Tax=Dunckerocampus dactyliophorus TaxID=161453 RepID=UPI002404DFB1|nr:hyaluronan mediated motility receptor isoform X2 [Dunckerocampus dactyliophorus]